MPKPILYGHECSSVVRSVFLVAKAIGLEFEYREVQLFTGEHLTDEFLKMNPQHTIPTLDDNGLYLSDSHAIIVYLMEKYGNRDDLYPKDDAYQRARINQRLHFDNGILYARLRSVVIPIYEENQKQVSAETMKGVYEAYDFMEKFLETDSYLAGNRLTIADLSCAANISSLFELVPADRNKYPKLHRWFDRIRTLSYYQDANGVGNEKYIALLHDFMAGKMRLAKHFFASYS